MLVCLWCGRTVGRSGAVRSRDLLQFLIASIPLDPDSPFGPGTPCPPLTPFAPVGPGGPWGPVFPGIPWSPFAPSRPSRPSRPGIPGVPGMPGTPLQRDVDFFKKVKHDTDIVSLKVAREEKG